MDKSSIIIITLIVYKLFLIFVGWFSRKKNKTIEDYFVGGKRLGPIITSISYSASNSSAWTLLGVSGIAFSRGVWHRFCDGRDKEYRQKCLKKIMVNEEH